MAEKLYHLLDACSNTDEIEETFTLQGMREWLVDFWNNNPNNDMEKQEHEEMIEEILASDEKELFNRLGGIGYYMEEVDGK